MTFFANRHIFLSVFIPCLLIGLSRKELREGKHDSQVEKVVSNLSVLPGRGVGGFYFTQKMKFHFTQEEGNWIRFIQKWISSNPNLCRYGEKRNTFMRKTAEYRKVSDQFWFLVCSNASISTMRKKLTWGLKSPIFIANVAQDKFFPVSRIYRFRTFC